MAPGRIKRPMDFIEKNPENRKELCPFCPGHEKKLESVVFQRPSKKWKVRLVKNKYPIVHPQLILKKLKYYKPLARRQESKLYRTLQRNVMLRIYYAYTKGIFRNPLNNYSKKSLE
jgi:galactose-1-phosphate uridylyltransferase